MAQNITLLGASYSAVPAVTLPKTGGGTAQFDDTTDANATASDILSGKTAYVNGVKITGTGSGGGGGSVTQDQDGYIVLPPDGGGGGGSSSVVRGTFTTGEGDEIETVSLGYSGNGYPISVSIYLAEGAYNSSGTAYNTIKQYAVITFQGSKNDTNTPPVYGTNQLADAFSSFSRYKSSDTYASNTSVGHSTTNYFLVDTDPITNSNGIVKINSSNQLKIAVKGSTPTGYGLLPNTGYNYCIEFSE